MNRQQHSDPELDRLTRQLLAGTVEKPGEPLCARIMSRIEQEKKQESGQTAPRTLSPVTIISWGLVYLLVLIGGFAWMRNGQPISGNWNELLTPIIFGMIPICGLAFFLLFNQLDEYLKSRNR